MIKKGYKVLTKYDVDHFRSYCGIKESTVRYYLNKWVRRPNLSWGPLAVFDTLEDVNSYLYVDDPNAVIFECEYIKSKQKFLRTPNIQDLKGITKDKDFPKGTVFANAVKLTKEVLGYC